METKIFSPKKVIDIDTGAQSLIGRKILGKNGEILGHVKDVVIEKQQIQGIIVTKNLKKYFVDYAYIQDMYTKSITLKIDPVIRLMGMKVFDIEGRKLGKVIDVVRHSNTNSLNIILVKKRIFSRPVEIPGEEIEVSGKNIILNKEY